MGVHVRVLDTVKSGKRFCIYFWHKGKRYDIYRFPDGKRLADSEDVEDLSNEIAAKIAAERRDKKNKFDPTAYLPPEHRGASFRLAAEKYIVEKQAAAAGDDISEKHADELENSFRKHFMPFFKDKLLMDITNEDIHNLRNSLPKGWAKSTLKWHLSKLKTFSKHLFVMGKISKQWHFEPVTGIRKPTFTPYSYQEQAAILDRIQVKHRPIFVFLARLGPRPSEAIAIIWHDVRDSTDLPTLHICRAIQRIKRKGRASTQKEKDKTKTGYERIIPLVDEVLQAFRSVKPDIVNPKANVFLNPNTGKPYSVKTLEEIWDKAAIAYGRRLPLYKGTKHSLGSQLLAAGYDMEYIRNLFGHTDIKTTVKYTRTLTETMRDMLSGAQKRHETEVIELKKVSE